MVKTYPAVNVHSLCYGICSQQVAQPGARRWRTKLCDYEGAEERKQFSLFEGSDNGSHFGGRTSCRAGEPVPPGRGVPSGKLIQRAQPDEMN